jgi:hypothetical protein
MARPADDVESRDGIEDAVGSEERRADLDRAGGDPQVVGVRSVSQGMSKTTAGVTELGDRCEQAIADGMTVVEAIACSRSSRRVGPQSAAKVP